METENEDWMADIYAEIMEEENAMFAEQKRIKNRIFKAILTVKGQEFLNDLTAYLNEPDFIGQFDLVRKPKGQNQEENCGLIKTLWVDQWICGTEADDFAGDVYIQLKENLYLKAGYSC